MEAIVRANFSFTIESMVDELNMKRPIYRKTSNFGFIGKEDSCFTWEKPKLKLVGIPEQIIKDLIKYKREGKHEVKEKKEEVVVKRKEERVSE